MKKLFIAVIAFCLIVSATVAGAEQKDPFSISALAGGYTFEGTHHLNTAPAKGGRVGYDLTQEMSVEALINYANTEGSRDNNSAAMFRFGADLLFNLIPDSRLKPNLAAGFSRISLDETGVNKRLRTAWSYGAGIKYFLTDSLALRADVRHIVYNHNYTTFNSLEYTGGIYIPFGGTKSAAKPAAAILPASPPGAPALLPERL